MDTDFSIVDYLEFSKGVLEVETNDNLLPVKRHYVRQAKELLFGIDTIHFLGEHPSVYFNILSCRFQSFRRNQLIIRLFTEFC